MTININPEFQNLIPPLTDQEQTGLERDLTSFGCRDPLVTWNGILLDGHNRLKICQRHKLPFKTVEIECGSESDARIWIIANQFNRRNLSDLSRAELAFKLEDEIRKQAKESYTDHVGRPSKSKAKLPTISKVNTRAILAATAGLSERTMDAARLILESGDEETREKVRRNEIAIHRAAKDIKEKRGRDMRRKARIQITKGATHDDRIIVGDFRKHADKVADGSVSLIFTDPPYDREASKMLPELAKFAADKLADGGSLICYVGQTQSP